MNNERRSPIVKVYEQTHRSVVNISGERVVTTSIWPHFNLPDIFDYWGPRYQREIKVLGSGVVAHHEGFIVTNAHVVEGANKIRVTFSDGKEFSAQVISIDSQKDLAVLKIDTDQPLPTIQLGRSDDLMIGETVVAIGNPYSYANTVTSGVISAIGRDIAVGEGFWLRGLIQTDAPINPGNSGGPLLNINGELIGINTAVKAEAENIGFAIPVDTLINNLSMMLMPEKLRRVRLGLFMGRKHMIGSYSGLKVESVAPASPAKEQGIQAGDIVTDIDQKPISNVLDFYILMIHKDIGEPIEIRYVRSGENGALSKTARLTIEPKPLPDGRLLTASYFQMTVSNLTERIARQFNFQGAYPIVIITSIDPRGIAACTGLKPGDLILNINGHTVRNMKELSIQLEQVTEGDLVAFEILRITVGPFGQAERRFLVRLKAIPQAMQDSPSL
jgi:serine protease Do